MNKFYCLLGALILMLNSCSEKEQTTPPSNVKITNIGKDVTFKDGRLVFKDSLAFNQHLNWIVQNANNPFEIKQFNNQIGLTSLNSIYEAGGNIQNYEDFTKYVDCNRNAYNVVDFDNSLIYEKSCPLVISFIGNQDGIFQIGDQICRYSGNYLLTTKEKDQSTIKQLYLPINEISKDKITVENMSYIPEGSTKGQYSYRTAYNGDRRRLVARLNGTTSGTLVTWEANSATQRKRCGWCPWIGENLSGDVGVNVYGIVRIKNKYGSNTWYNETISSNSQGNWQSASVLVWGIDYHVWDFDVKNSYIRTTHIGAGQTIINDNVFNGYY